MVEYNTIIDELEKKRVAFEDDTYAKPTTRDTARWATLLSNGDGSSDHLSSGRKSVRRRAHELSTRIGRELGKGVLLLVLSQLDQQKLATLEKRTFTDALRKWWNNVEHPDALTMVASECLTLPSSGRAIVLRKQRSTESTPTGQNASAAFESAILESSASIPGPEDRKAWVTIAYAHLRLLERLSCITNNDAVNAKVAIMADMDHMEDCVGNRLYRAVQASRMRKDEQGRLTKAFPLYLARDSGEDFVLEIWMCSSHARSILEEEKRMTSIEGWRAILGEYLYTAMRTSKSRKIEEDVGQSKTDAIKLCFPNGDHYDSKLEVKINFDMGRVIWSRGYP